MPYGRFDHLTTRFIQNLKIKGRGQFFDPLRDFWKLKVWKVQKIFLKICMSYLSLFLMMKLLALSISIHPWNTSGFITSGSKLSSYFRKLNLRKELNLSQILEVDETLQLYSACLKKQKVSGDLLLQLRYAYLLQHKP